MKNIDFRQWVAKTLCSLGEYYKHATYFMFLLAADSKYVGFGNTPAPKEDEGPDLLSGAMSSLSTGWQYAAKWTSSAATRAKENVSRFTHEIFAVCSACL